MVLNETWYRPYPFWHRDRIRSVLITLLVNCAIALVTYSLHAYGSFLEHLLISNACGYSMWTLCSVLSWGLCGRLFPWHLVAGVPLGLYIGLKLAAWAGAEDMTLLFAADSGAGRGMFPAILVLAFAGAIFCVLFTRAMSTRAMLSEERRKAAAALQSETSARLALLQAQIEPHFLFNTLANVQSLIERDPPMARDTLKHLNHYLRVSLVRTRKPVSTLAEELDLVRTLLAIAAVRLGPRLRYSVTVADGLDAILLPPLLLQPLVENALEHGIEPSIEGGEIRIRCERQDDTLHLRVHDNGAGLRTDTEDGVGLSNVRARLASLYGDKGRLALYANRPTGVIAELILPLQTA